MNKLIIYFLLFSSFPLFGQNKMSFSVGVENSYSLLRQILKVNGQNRAVLYDFHGVEPTIIGGIRYKFNRLSLQTNVGLGKRYGFSPQMLINYEQGFVGRQDFDILIYQDWLFKTDNDFFNLTLLKADLILFYVLNKNHNLGFGIAYKKYLNPNNYRNDHAGKEVYSLSLNYLYNFRQTPFSINLSGYNSFTIFSANTSDGFHSIVLRAKNMGLNIGFRYHF